MMTTLFFICASIALSVLVARYNEDDSLFWKLAMSFIGAYAAGVIVSSAIKDDKHKKENVVVINSMPTQVLEGTPCALYTLADVALSATMREKSPKPVSKVNNCYDHSNLLSEVRSSARGQPHFYMYFSDS